MLGNEILAAASKTSSSSSSTFLLIIVVLVVLFYFVMIRPQSKRRRQVMEQQRAAQPGQRVRTTAGMYATVVAVDGDDVILEVAPGVQVRCLKRAIMEVLPDGGGAATGPGYAGEPATESADAPTADAPAADAPVPGPAPTTAETVTPEAGDTSLRTGDEVTPPTGDGSPNGSSPAADDSRTRGNV